MAIVNSKLFVYQRVRYDKITSDWIRLDQLIRLDAIDLD